VTVPVIELVTEPVTRPVTGAGTADNEKDGTLRACHARRPRPKVTVSEAAASSRHTPGRRDGELGPPDSLPYR
jgi:hypothetical protein